MPRIDGALRFVAEAPRMARFLFDAGIVYAPIFGRNFYAGVRWAFGR